MSNLNNFSDQILFKSVKSILESSELKTYEKMILIVIKTYQVEYGDVFPDYDTIADAGGMSKRKAQYVIKDLQERKMIEKSARFKNIADGNRKQTSNRYIIVDELNSAQCKDIQNPAQCAHENAQHALINEYSCAQHAPYNAGLNNQESLNLYTSTELKQEEEDIYITREREKQLKKYACYAQVFNQMIQDQGTGVLCFKQEEFLKTCKSYNIPVSLVNELYTNVKEDIQRYHYEAIPRTFEKFTTRLARKKIDNPISWFVATYRNENYKVLMENELNRKAAAS